MKSKTKKILISVFSVLAAPSLVAPFVVSCSNNSSESTQPEEPVIPTPGQTKIVLENKDIQVFSDILLNSIPELMNEFQVLKVEEKIYNDLSTLNVITTNRIKVSKVRLNKQQDLIDNYVAYKPSFELSAKLPIEISSDVVNNPFVIQNNIFTYNKPIKSGIKVSSPQPQPEPVPPKPDPVEPQPGPTPPPIPDPVEPPIVQPSGDGTMHSINLATIKQAKSPLEIIANSKMFKDAVDQMYVSLNSYDWRGRGFEEQADFMYNIYNQKMQQTFFELNKEVGISGEYTYNKNLNELTHEETLHELMKCAPSQLEAVGDMTQKYLPNYTVSDTMGVISKTVDLNEIITLNQFGFLPSNLSQLLYYLDYNGIAEIFNLQNEVIQNIQANFEDGKLKENSTNQREKAYINILITTKDHKYLYEITKDNTSALKCDYDFFKYIYDRSFSISWPSFYVSKANTGMSSHSQDLMSIQARTMIGTCWVFDRVINPELEAQGYIELLVGTNLHVLDLSDAFNKDRKQAGYSIWNGLNVGYPVNKSYDKHWDGGFKATKKVGSDVPSSITDKIVTITPSDKTYSRYQEIQSRQPNFNYAASVSLKSTDNPDEALNSNGVTKGSVPTNITNTNAVQKSVWYTPELKTEGTWTIKQNNSTYGSPFDPINPNDLEQREVYNGCYTGTISNGGGDFAVTKIAFKKEDAYKLFPTLKEAIDQNKEDEWYMGLGKRDNQAAIPSANSTIFAGGFPLGGWCQLKSNSGKISSQPRHLTDDFMGNVQSYWTTYNEADNVKFNTYRGLVDWYKDYNNFQMPSMTAEENLKYNPHGMQIQKVLQQSIITYSNMGGHDFKDIMLNGSSGSLLINSRFEPIGINYSGEFKDPILDSNGTVTDAKRGSCYNIGMLFNNYSRMNAKFSIINQILDKLTKENTYTHILRSKQ